MCVIIKSLCSCCGEARLIVTRIDMLSNASWNCQSVKCSAENRLRMSDFQCRRLARAQYHHSAGRSIPVVTFLMRESCKGSWKAMLLWRAIIREMTMATHEIMPLVMSWGALYNVEAMEAITRPVTARKRMKLAWKLKEVNYASPTTGL